ncbi:MAG: hypothetical protein JW862_05005, partial [Anaerolineales bacterium]|nr:hypothetical protein [Anaerolineales bacterium]
MTVQTSTPSDPFALGTGDLDLHFSDAKIIQAVLVPTMLLWQLEGGGFFVETQDEAPTPEFVPATFVTSQGGRRAGFGTQSFIAYPVSYRTFWQHKGGRDFSRTQVLAVLANGIWAVVTTKSTASKALSSAIKTHVQWVARQLQQAPFAVPLRFQATGVQRMQESNVVTYGFDTLVDARCPVEIGADIRVRWPEVLAWRAKARSGGGQNNGSPATACLERTSSRDPLVYRDQTPVDPANPREVAAFTR